jgi:hypothetical protein
MAVPLASSIADLLLGLELAGTGTGPGNRMVVEGFALHADADGARTIQVRRLELAALQIASGPLTRPAPVAAHAQASAWSLAPLAAANGAIRGEIVDAHLVFDAQVAVPIRQGVVDFNDATVEHVGPDSRMGVSERGIYVDAPNGRSHLFEFPALPEGVEVEGRRALPGPWRGARGRLRLQEFVESMLRQGAAGQSLAFSEQARQLIARTALAGDLRLGDGTFAAPGITARLSGRAQGHNALRLHSDAVGKGLIVDIDALDVRDAQLDAVHARVRCEEVAGALRLRLLVDGAHLRCVVELATLVMRGLQIDLPGPRPGQETGFPPRAGS